ncbi:MAG: hypothetical protein ACE361_06315 [Aureliella sp.]
MRFQTTGLCAAACMLALCGCQSWNTGYPIQSPSRVPPPGTGSFQTSSPYYNGAGNYNGTGNVSQNYPAAVPGYGVPQSYSAPAPVQPATFTAPQAQPSGVVPAAQFSPVNNAAFRDTGNQPASERTTTNFSDSNSNFQWQN